MGKAGQARILDQEQQDQLFEVIKTHRYPEKNTAIMQISFKLALRVQEISLLQIKEVASLGPPRKHEPQTFKILEILTLPASYTKGANAMKRSKNKPYTRKSVTFTVEHFAETVKKITKLARSGKKINPESFFPPVVKHTGQSRDLPLVDQDLRQALEEHLTVRLAQDPKAKPTSPLFLTQKRVAYSPNTLQEHIALILRVWLGVEKASSHSGRRTVITNVIHKQKKSVKVAQKIAGHASAATTLIYEEPPPDAIADALANLKS